MIFDALWKRVVGKIGHLMKKLNSLRVTERSDGEITKTLKTRLASVGNHEIFMNPEFDVDQNWSENSTVAARSANHMKTLSRKKTASRRKTPQTRSRHSLETMATPKRIDVDDENGLP